MSWFNPHVRPSRWLSRLRHAMRALLLHRCEGGRRSRREEMRMQHRAVAVLVGALLAGAGCATTGASSSQEHEQAARVNTEQGSATGSAGQQRDATNAQRAQEAAH